MYLQGVLKQLPLFSKLSEEELEALSPYFKVKHVHSGEYLVREGEIAEAFFILISGTAEVLKSAPPVEGEIFEPEVLRVMHSGSGFGETALFEHQPRTADVRVKDSGVVLVLSSDDFRKIRDLYPPLYAKCLERMTRSLSQRLRDTNEVTVVSLKKEVLRLKEDKRNGRLFIYLLVLLSVYHLGAGYILRYRDSTLGSLYLPLLIIFMSAFGAAVAAKHSGLPKKFFGFSWDGFREHSKYIMKMTLIFLMVATIAKAVAVHYVPPYVGRDLFFFTLKNYIETKGYFHALLRFFLEIFIYCAFVPVQQIIFCCMQPILGRLVPGKYSDYWALVLTAMLFGMTHLHINPQIAIMFFIPGLFMRYVFMRFRSYPLVILAHWMIGVYGIFVIDVRNLIL